MLKVLIVEDNVLLADLLEEYLIMEGYDVCGTAATVDKAVVLADLHNPDLAIFDFRLAGGEYSSQIRPLLKDKITMGIVYASGDDLNGRLSKLDGDAYIQKPYGMNDLICALRIVQDIRTNNGIDQIPFPKGFHLLEDFARDDRKSS